MFSELQSLLVSWESNANAYKVYKSYWSTRHTITFKNSYKTIHVHTNVLHIVTSQRPTAPSVFYLLEVV